MSAPPHQRVCAGDTDSRPTPSSESPFPAMFCATRPRRSSGPFSRPPSRGPQKRWPPIRVLSVDVKRARDASVAMPGRERRPSARPCAQGGRGGAEEVEGRSRAGAAGGISGRCVCERQLRVSELTIRRGRSGHGCVVPPLCICTFLVESDSTGFHLGFGVSRVAQEYL